VQRVLNVELGVKLDSRLIRSEKSAISRMIRLRVDVQLPS